jgi:cytochrome P450
MMNDPDHMRIRQILNPFFRPSSLKQAENRIDEICRRVVTDGLKRGNVDGVPSVAEPVAMGAMSCLLGIPEVEQSSIAIEAKVASQGLDRTTSKAVSREVRQSDVRLREYAHELATRPDRSPLVAALCAAEDGGEISRRELNASIALLLIAGVVTSVSFLAQCQYFWSMRPPRSELEINPWVEGVLRRASPVTTGVSRVVTRDCLIEGNKLSRGDEVVVMFAAANSDPERFSGSVGGDDSQHLAFGRGPHACIGAPLARLEGRILGRTLLEQGVCISLLGPPKLRNTKALQEMTSLMVDYRTTHG